MRRTIFTAASVVALMLGTAMAQTSTSPNATGGTPSTLDRSMDCDSGSPTAKAPGAGAGSTTSRDGAGSTTSHDSAGTADSGTSSNSRTAMTDCGPKSGSTLPPGSKSPSTPSPSGTQH